VPRKKLSLKISYLCHDFIWKEDKKDRNQNPQTFSTEAEKFQRCLEFLFFIHIFAIFGRFGAGIQKLLLIYTYHNRTSHIRHLCWKNDRINLP
jgi:hypothetical protein